jgi:tight adherence protein B
LPEAFEMMSRAIKSGQTVSGAFQVVARDFASPLKEEFAYCHEQQCLGLPQDVALRELARRTSVMELQMLVVAILVQRQSGGNPVLLLENLASVVRKRLRLKTKVKALTGEGRMQALVLLLLPPLLLAAIYFLNRSYAEKLLEHPELLWGMAGSEAVGAFCIWKILNFGY